MARREKGKKKYTSLINKYDQIELGWKRKSGTEKKNKRIRSSIAW